MFYFRIICHNNIVKSQKASTKLQINSNVEYMNTQTTLIIVIFRECN